MENNQEISMLDDEKKGTPFWSNIFRKDKSKNQDIIDILSEIPIFKKLSKKQKRKVSLIVYERSYNADEFLFKEGNPGSGMFIIKDGSISIERTSETGEFLKLATLSAGDFVGELALLDDSPRSASARCNKKTTVVVFFREDLFNLIEREPVLGGKILTELAIMIGERLKETNKALLKYKKLAESAK